MVERQCGKVNLNRFGCIEERDRFRKFMNESKVNIIRRLLVPTLRSADEHKPVCLLKTINTYLGTWLLEGHRAGDFGILMHQIPVIPTILVEQHLY